MRTFVGQVAACAIVGVGGFSASSVQAQACKSVYERMHAILGDIQETDAMVLAHRGYWGKHAKAPNLPENSFNSIGAAAANCADGIEIDVKMTSDGKPIAMHDFNLGRTTDIWAHVANGSKYDPMTNRGTNPTVATTHSSTISKLRLLTPDRRQVTFSPVPAVNDLLFQMSRGFNGNFAPVIFDIKTGDAVRAVDAIARKIYVDFTPNYVATKVNATMYPHPDSFKRDASGMRAIPVFTTNMLGVIDVTTAAAAWMARGNVLEINMKQRGGLLAQAMQNALIGNNRVGVFHTLPDGPISGSFYKNTGQCCYKLSDLYYTWNTPGGTAKDTADNRGDLNFIMAMGFRLITSDDPDGVVRFLAPHGFRRHHPSTYPVTPTYNP